MRILFLTDNFPPEGNAPASRTYEHAIRWVKQGHKVTVITGAPNFPEGEVYVGYKNSWYNREDMDGIDVVRVKTYITSNQGFVKRILDYLSFMVSGFVAGIFQKSPDLIIATSPQFFNAISGWALSAVKGKPFIFELRDIWPASITAVGAMQNSKIIRFLERIEIFLYRKASRIISVTESFKNELIARGIDGAKIEVVLNAVDLSRYAPVTEKDSDLEEHLGLKGKFVVGYIGTHGMAHGLENIVDAAEALQHRDDILFMFAGGGAAREHIEKYVCEKQLKNVIMIARQPKELMPKLWSLCDISLVNLIDTPLFSTVIPSKIFESMGMGIPMVVSMPLGEATDIIHDTGAGIVVKPESSEELARALILIRDDTSMWLELSKNASTAALVYNRDRTAQQMLDIFETVVQS